MRLWLWKGYGKLRCFFGFHDWEWQEKIAVWVFDPRGDFVCRRRGCGRFRTLRLVIASDEGDHV